MAAPQRPPLYFGSVNSVDLRLRVVDLSAWFAPGDGPAGTPTAAVVAISAGDQSPLEVVGAAAWDTGPRNVFVGPFGRPFLSAGPRIVFTIQGGTKGNEYTILISFQDTNGQSVSVPVYQAVQWGPGG